MIARTGARAELPLRVVNSAAPIRICDMGGWTDTWFAGHGKIFNIGVSPYVEVQIAVYPRSARAEQVMLYAENYAERFAITPGHPTYARHPLLEATVEEMIPPEEYALEISIHSQVPAGASTGTSAAVSVALIGALDALTPGRLTPHEIAYAAHRVETQRLKLQSGIQDQLCAAYGSLNYIEMLRKEFPLLVPNRHDIVTLRS
jgi:D-glycero-alpha-D-manno-heptose-7-phosphate kinase